MSLHFSNLDLGRVHGRRGRMWGGINRLGELVMPFLSSRYHVSTVMVMVAGGGGGSGSGPGLDEVIEFCRLLVA